VVIPYVNIPPPPNKHFSPKKDTTKGVDRKAAKILTQLSACASVMGSAERVWFLRMFLGYVR